MFPLFFLSFCIVSTLFFIIFNCFVYLLHCLLIVLTIFLISVSVDSPIYIRPHSKTVLTLAITNDTHVLSSHLVMDYSLLVGIDDATKELVVGIIGIVTARETINSV